MSEGVEAGNLSINHWWPRCGRLGGVQDSATREGGARGLPYTVLKNVPLDCLSMGSVRRFAQPEEEPFSRRSFLDARNLRTRDRSDPFRQETAMDSTLF